MILPAYVWGLGAVMFTLVSMGPYIIMTAKGTNRPHIFSWIIWAILSVIAFFIQFAGGAGAGAWATGATALCCLLIALVSIQNGEKTITRLDWASFILALLILPVWLMTDNPSLATVLLVMIDGLGYVPTFRKVWAKPREEMIYTHAVTNIKHGLSLLAMGTLSVPTALYPASLFVFNAVLVGVIWGRRVVFLRVHSVKP